MINIPKETSTLEPSTHSISQSTIGPDTVESETSADELSQDFGPSSSFSNKRLIREAGKRSSYPDLKICFKKGHLELAAGLAVEVGSRRGDSVFCSRFRRMAEEPNTWSFPIQNG